MSVMMSKPISNVIVGSSTRRSLLRNGMTVVAAASSHGTLARTFGPFRRSRTRLPVATVARMTAQSLPMDPAPASVLAQRAVEAAQRAGASYADARLTRIVMHSYGMDGQGSFNGDQELLGVGVRALVNGAWGFAASPMWDTDEVVRLAHDAVIQAKANAAGEHTPLELATAPVARGTWMTPIRIDPFTIPIEEKMDYIVYWKARAEAADIPYKSDGFNSGFGFVRHEQVLATSEGTHVQQTRYETRGLMILGKDPSLPSLPSNPVSVKHLELAGAGWELLLDAKIPDQFPALHEEWRKVNAERVSLTPLEVGRYTLVCDGDVMARILNATLGMATQLDRAMGYEANAGGTSFLNDPLAMVGTFPVASPLVTVSANRSAPTQLATVKWDDEGVEPADTILVRDGMLMDFQTTREQASWLGPYYARADRPVRSNGYAASQDGLSITLQHMPNLALTPTRLDTSVDALVSTVQDGIFLDGAHAVQCDFQGSNGLILPNRMWTVKHGRIDKEIRDGAVSFNTLNFWKNITTLGGLSTVDALRFTPYPVPFDTPKGEPAQFVSRTIIAPAAVVEKQIVLDPRKKA